MNFIAKSEEGKDYLPKATIISNQLKVFVSRFLRSRLATVMVALMLT